MTVAVALLAAVAFGTADFLGGLAGRRLRPGDRAGTLTISAGAQVAGFGLALVVALVATLLGVADVPGGPSIVIAALAGVGNAVGVSALYRGLAVGKMAVVAPLTAAVTSIVPVLVGLVAGERPPPLVTVGVVLAIVAAVAVTRPDADQRRSEPDTTVSGWRYGVVAGLGLAAALSLLGNVGTTEVLWPLAFLKGAAMVVLLGASAALRDPVRPPRHITWAVVAVGVLDAAALAAYQWTATRGLLVVAAVLASLYPVVTVLLARRVFSETLSARQLAAVAAALLGIALIAAG